jgi:uncharacterized protein
MKELIKTIVKDFHERGIPGSIERDIKIPLDSGKIVTLVGPRRAGKTFLLYQVMLKIQDTTNIVYINFEDERLQLSAKDLQVIIDAYLELYPQKKESEIYFFFDEIQEIEGWEKFVRRVYDTITKNVFITGSSAKLLSKEIATSLRGRTITYEVYPLSFHEFIRFAGSTADMHATRGKAKLRDAFVVYLQKGGFPETVNMEEEVYRKTITNYFEVMLYRDIVGRYKVTNILPLKNLLKKIIANTACDVSIHKIFNDFKSQGIKVSKDSLYKYMEHGEDAYVVFTLHNFSESISNQGAKKSYCIDTGMSSLLSFTLSKDFGRLLENIVFLELKRRGKNIFFYRNKHECDFVIKEKEKIGEAIQVCYTLDEQNREREFEGLKGAMECFDLKKGTIITSDQEETIGNIKIIPAWKWLLMDKKRKI